MYNANANYADIKPAKIPLPKAPVTAQHPFKSKANHQKLMEYVMPRMLVAREARDGRVERYAQIDKQVYGWMQLSTEDKKRRVAKERTGKGGVTEMNLPISYVHLDDMMSYYAQIFAPSQGMFNHKGKPDETAEATQLVTLMNNHAIYTGMYRDVIRTLFNLLKYNEGGFHGYWFQDYGPVLRSNAEGTQDVQEEIRWQGNKACALDVYNTFYDPHVDIAELHKEGEYCAIVEKKSHFWLQSRAAKGIYYNVDEALQCTDDKIDESFYRCPPEEAQLKYDESGGTDWKSVVAGQQIHSAKNGFEILKVWIRLNPTEFGLVPAEQRAARNRFEIWQVTICNGQWIIGAQWMNNIHGYLPCFMARINDDFMEEATKSTAEILNPLQDFASHLLNAHVKATRRNIYGTTIYDPSIVDLAKIPDGEVSARIPVKATGYGKDLRLAIWNDQKQLDTKQTLQDLEYTMGLLNQFFPVQALPSQIAGIDRATNEQVAAVQQGTNRRQQKGSQLLDISLFRNLRFAFFYNIIQYQPNNVSVSDFHGRPITIDLNAIKNTDLPFIIGQGLKVLDRQAAAQTIERVTFALLQSQQADQVDILGLITYMVNMMDIDVDLNQFKRPVQQVPTQTGVEQVPGQAPSETPTGGQVV